MKKSLSALLGICFLSACTSMSKTTSSVGKCPSFYVLSGSSRLPLTKSGAVLDEIYCSTKDVKSGSYEIYLKPSFSHLSTTKTLLFVTYAVGVMDKDQQSPLFYHTYSKKLDVADFGGAYHKITLTFEQPLPLDSTIYVGFDLSEQDLEDLKKENQVKASLMNDQAKAYDFRKKH